METLNPSIIHKDLPFQTTNHVVHTLEGQSWEASHTCCPSSRHNNNSSGSSSGTDFEVEADSILEGLSTGDFEATISENCRSSHFKERHLGKSNRRGTCHAKDDVVDSDCTDSDNHCDNEHDAHIKQHQILKACASNPMKGSLATRRRGRLDADNAVVEKDTSCQPGREERHQCSKLAYAQRAPFVFATVQQL